MDETVLYICKNCKKICSGNYFEVSVNKNICPSCKTEKGLKRLNISVEKWRSLSSEQKKEEKEKLILEIESEAEKELENQRRENELKEQQLRASLFAEVHGLFINQFCVYLVPSFRMLTASITAPAAICRTMLTGIQKSVSVPGAPSTVNASRYQSDQEGAKCLQTIPV